MKTKNKIEQCVPFNDSHQQGDVVLTPSTIPADAEIVESFCGVVQEGEVTGHAHRFAPQSGVMLFNHKPSGKRFLRVVEPSALSHEEHRTQTIPPGTYEVGIVRETDWMTRAIRRVVD